MLLRMPAATVAVMCAPPADLRPESLRGPSADVLARVSDALPWPLLALLPDATLLHANLAARDLLRLGHPLQLSAERRVMPALAHQRAGFEAALAAAATQSQRALLHWPEAGPGSGPGWAATVTSLGVAATGPGTLLLTLVTADIRLAAAAAYAAQQGLSPDEARVLRRLALGENSTQAAAALGLAPSAVRSLVARLRRKTGHRSVWSLLQALAGMPPAGLATAPAAEGK